MVGSALRADLGSVVGDAARSARSADPTRCKQGRTSQMISLPSVGLSALAQPRLTKGGQPYPKTVPCVVPFNPPRSRQRSPQFSPPTRCLYVVTRSRPYPQQTRSARSADPTSRKCPEITKNDEPRTKNNPDSQPPTADTYLLIRPNFSPAALRVSSFLAKWKRT